MKKKQVLSVKNFHDNVKRLPYQTFFNMFQATYDKDELEKVGRELGLEGAPPAPDAPEEAEADDLTGENKTGKKKK